MKIQRVSVALSLAVVVGAAVVAQGCGGSTDGDTVVKDAGAGDAALTGLTISSIALFQGPKAVLVKDGAAMTTLNAPVISGRPGLLRVYVTPSAGWAARAVTATLQITGGGAPISVPPQELTVTVASSDTTPDSTFDFPLTAADVPPSAALSVTLKDATGAATSFPTDGSVLALQTMDAMTLKIEVVPLQYNPDGSGRVSDTSATAIQGIHDVLFDMYPVSSVEITVRAEPLPITASLDSMGGGWNAAFTALGGVRASDAVSDDTYLIGLVDPAATWDAYCPDSVACTESVGPGTPAPTVVSGRLALTCGFPENIPSNIPYALGKALGRFNAPCGATLNLDPSFPYPGAISPAPGYDIVGGMFVASGYPDIMGWCFPTWVTDYTFSGLAARIDWVDNQQ